MSTLTVVEDILREATTPLTVKQIVERAGVRLPSRSKTPDTVVARDLSMDMKKKGDASLFARPFPGLYCLRSQLAVPAGTNQERGVVVPVLSVALRADRAPTLAARTPSSVEREDAPMIHASLDQG